MTYQALQTMTSENSFSSEQVSMSDFAEAVRYAENHPYGSEEGELAYDPDGARAFEQIAKPRSA
jgi:hypothetical protein